MRIANNIMAINTHRRYSINNDNVRASAEKLSSGLSINRAADDAAGLAISEKMRSQVRGLNMATRNSQDAVSLIQTAEGALQEVHSMLQRMNELAVQSATGTNETFDRTQIGKEFEQLKREINDISEQTTFNNMKVLDGSLSASGPARAAYSSGVYAGFEADASVNLPGGIKDVTITGGKTYFAGSAAQFTIDLKDVVLSADISAYTTALTVNGQGISIGGDAHAGDTGADIAALFNNSSLNLDGVKYDIVASGTTLKFKPINNADVDVDELNSLNVTSALMTGLPPRVTNAVGGTAESFGTIAESSFTFDYKATNSGDKFSIGTVAYTFYNSYKDNITDAQKAALDADPHAIDLDKVTSAATLIDFINGTPEGLTPYREKSIKASLRDNGSIVIKYNGNAANLDKKTNISGLGEYGPIGDRYVVISSTPKNNETNGTTTFEIDTMKLKAGDKLTYENDYGTKHTWEFKKGDTVKTIAEAFGISQKALDGNTWSVKNKLDQSSRLQFEAAPDYKDYGVMKIQVGALENEQLDIKIASMNTTGLGLDEQKIFTQKGAGTAITTVRTAINTVSDQRALLGAMQNRLAHKIANLKISSENLQASESRIRDVDIASEMTKFTKDNILAQAATSMLAQANNMPQNVLSLLR